MRPSQRAPDEMRPVSLSRGAAKYAEGSCLIRMGGTLVHCTASVETGVPSFKKGTGEGWVTAEYAMLPRATVERTPRERTGPGGRTQEIQRLIGRSLRAVIDTAVLGPRSIQIDCDVIQADGGTRTASITGAFVALHDAIAWLKHKKLLEKSPIKDFVAAVSVGIHNGVPVLDLDYAEDSSSGTDMNVVMTGAGTFVEVQGTAEGAAFSRRELDALLDLAGRGIAQLVAAQKNALGVA